MADLTINILADTRNAVRELKRVQEETQRIQKQTLTFAKIATTINAVSAAWNVLRSTISSVARTLSSLASAAKTQIDAERKLEAVLRATGGAAGLAAEELKAYAAELQGITNFGDEATIEAMALLATFTQIRGPIFKDAIAVMQDMSAVLGQSLTQGAIKLGKALNDPIAGITALRQVGVSFNEQQMEQIRLLQESGDLMAAQRIILDELNRAFGGAAKALADPATQMKNAWGDVQEQLGEIFLRIWQALGKLLLPVLQSFIEYMQSTPTYSNVFVIAMEAVLDVIHAIYRGISLIMGTIYAVGEGLTWLVSKMPAGIIGEGTKEMFSQMSEEYGRWRQGAFERALGGEWWGTQFADAFAEVTQQMQEAQQQAKGVGAALADGMRENQEKIMSILDGLREELETIGMSETEKKLRELRGLGATPEELAEAERLLAQIEAQKQAMEEQKRAQEELNKAKEEAARIAESVLSPEEKQMKEIQRAQELFKQGLLSADIYMKYLEQQKAALMPPPEEMPTKQFAAAMTAGTGAFSAIISAMSAYREAAAKPEKDTAKNTSRMVEQLDALLAEVRKQNTEQYIEI